MDLEIGISDFELCRSSIIIFPEVPTESINTKSSKISSNNKAVIHSINLEPLLYLF